MTCSGGQKNFWRGLDGDMLRASGKLPRMRSQRCCITATRAATRTYCQRARAYNAAYNVPFHLPDEEQDEKYNQLYKTLFQQYLPRDEFQPYTPDRGRDTARIRKAMLTAFRSKNPQRVLQLFENTFKVTNSTSKRYDRLIRVCCRRTSHEMQDCIITLWSPPSDYGNNQKT